MADQRLVVVGASLAGLRAVEAARKHGHTGPITLIGAERHLPYDRPPLSKQYFDASVEAVAPWFREESHLRDDLAVELLLGEPATGLDPERRLVRVGDREVPYDLLVIATGVAARHLPGIDPTTPGVHGLRTLDDAAAIRAGMDRGDRVVVVGCGFIGSEVASALHQRGRRVTLVE
ncbi:MAG: FAD-dependent oxidoreductase, partial [Actinomycetales bacterium]